MKGGREEGRGLDNYPFSTPVAEVPLVFLDESIQDLVGVGEHPVGQEEGVWIVGTGRVRGQLQKQ